MRACITGLLIAGMLTAQTGFAERAAAEPCAQPRDKSAFDVIGLKSQMMVTALSCNAQERYNAFVLRYRAALLQHERTLVAYFGRAFGRHGRQEHDEYITNLANVQSQSGLKLGAGFCAKNLGLFDQVMALRSSTDLPVFAAAQPVEQPLAITLCPLPHAKRTRTAQADTGPHP